MRIRVRISINMQALRSPHRFSAMGESRSERQGREGAAPKEKGVVGMRLERSWLSPVPHL